MHTFKLFSGPAGDDKSARMAAEARVLDAFTVVVDFKNVSVWGQWPEWPVMVLTPHRQEVLIEFAGSLPAGSVLCVDGIQFSRVNPEDVRPEVAAVRIIREARLRNASVFFTWTGDEVPDVLRKLQEEPWNLT